MTEGVINKRDEKEDKGKNRKKGADKQYKTMNKEQTSKAGEESEQ